MKFIKTQSFSVSYNLHLLQKGNWSLKKGRKCRRSEVELGVVDSPTARPKRLRWEKGIQGQLEHIVRNWGQTYTRACTPPPPHTHIHTPHPQKFMGRAW